MRGMSDDWTAEGIGNQMPHAPVLLEEAVRALLERDGGLYGSGSYIDATFGRGGHSARILADLSADGQLLAIDRDADAVAVARGDARFQDARFAVLHAPFSVLQQQPAGSASGVLMDLGVSSPQLDEAQRGFSFTHDGPLDMRMDAGSGESVAEWLARVDAATLAGVIKEYGEERRAKAVAQTIVRYREQGGVLSGTLQLAKLVADVVGYREQGRHPATRTFQALRIFINDELGQLKAALEASLRVLEAGGRLVVIAFHSLEDRIVKQFIARHSREVVDKSRPDWMLRPPQPLLLHSLGRVRPTAAEVERNPRARSAVMRVAERTATPWAEGVGGAAV